MARRGLRVLQQTHGQRLRLRRLVQHADCVPGRLGSFTDRRVHGTPQPRRAPRLQRVRRDGAYECDLFTARRRRASCWSSRKATSGSTTIRSSMRRRTCSTSSRSGSAHGRRCRGGTIPVSSPARSASLEDALALTADQQAAIGFFCGSQVRHARRARSRPRLHDVELRCDAAPDPCRRHGRRCDQSTAYRASPSVRSRNRSRQSPAHRQNETAGSLQRHQPDEQGRALQLPVDVQRHALRDAARVPAAGRRDVLTAVTDAVGDQVVRPPTERATSPASC